MSSDPQLEFPLELVQGVAGIARSLVAAVQNWMLYPPQHPAVRSSLDRFAQAVHQATAGSSFSMGVTPQTLLVDGRALPPLQPVAEAARLLHDRDLLQLTFAGAVPVEALHDLLRLLSLDAAERRDKGGPEGIWRRAGHQAISLRQIDYGSVLEDREEDPQKVRRDDVWQSIVHSITSGQTMDERAQQRLLMIAGDPEQIRELAMAVMANKCTPDGSPMITTQAATVLAAFQHLASVVSVKSPEQTDAVMQHLTTAAAGMEPAVLVQMLEGRDVSDEAAGLVRGMVGTFDDAQVAQVLASVLSTEGQATSKLAEVFDTIAPDEERKQRVLAQTRTVLSQGTLGQSGQFKAIWSSMEELLISYNEKPFVSDQYRAALDGAGARAGTIAARDLPAEMPEWMESLGRDNVRQLSVILIIDLLRLARDPVRAAEIAADMAALGEDLLMSGDYAQANEIAAALSEAAAREAFPAREACQQALSTIASSAAMQEAVAGLGELEPKQAEIFRALCGAMGPASVDALGATLNVEAATVALERAADIIVSFGAAAVQHLAPFLDQAPWFAQCHAADILGRIAAPEAVPLLQPMLRRTNARVLRHALAALTAINHPSAGRAIHTVLRTATGETRRIVIDVLVAGRDVRVVPMLVRILEESKPLGDDHQVVLDTLGALKTVHTEQAVRPVAKLMRQRKWFARRKTRALKITAVDTLAAIGSADARGALNAAMQDGDRLLRKILKARATEVAVQ